MGLPTTLTDADWAGLCALTETSQPGEQLYVLWVIRNRVDSGRFGGQFKRSYESVVLQPSQFSAFDAYQARRAGGMRSETLFDAVFKDKKYSSIALLSAVHLADRVLNSGSVRPTDFPSDVYHYWSPVSMKPAGSRPPWAPSAKRLFTPSGLDPKRFIFAEGVP